MRQHMLTTKDFDLRNTACAQSAHSDMRCPSLNGCLHGVASNNWLPKYQDRDTLNLS